MLLYWLRRLYSLDTLDTRFTISSKTPAAVTEEPPIDPSKQAQDYVKRHSQNETGRSQDTISGAQPSKWATPEFFIYYLVFLTVVPNMFKAVYDVSKGRATMDNLENRQRTS